MSRVFIEKCYVGGGSYREDVLLVTDYDLQYPQEVVGETKLSAAELDNFTRLEAEYFRTKRELIARQSILPNLDRETIVLEKLLAQL